MKKRAFTLAEILIVLGIIGLIAIIILPLLQNNTSTQTIASKLDKTYNTLSNANALILANDLEDSLNFDVNEYRQQLTNNIRNSVINGNNVILPDRTSISIEDIGESENDQYDSQGSFMGPYMKITVNLSPQKATPINGVDNFYFIVDRNGTVFPIGGSVARQLGHSDYTSTTNSYTPCTTKNESKSSEACAGAFFDQNMKPTYMKCK